MRGREEDRGEGKKGKWKREREEVYIDGKVILRGKKGRRRRK